MKGAVFPAVTLPVALRRTVAAIPVVALCCRQTLRADLSVTEANRVAYCSQELVLGLSSAGLKSVIAGLLEGTVSMDVKVTLGCEPVKSFL